MAAVARYLVDTSAFARHRYPEVAHVLDPLLNDGVVATCGIVEFEVLYSDRGPKEYAELARLRRGTLEWLPIEDVDIRRGLDVQAELARLSRHRIAWPDLITAAVAERHRVTVLHYDADFDRINGVTEQPVEWVVPKGSVP